MRHNLIFIIFYGVVNYPCNDAKNESSGRLSFCSFFNNRSPQSQPTLTNCTWFRENSCCLQHEIDVSFSRVKPLIGASETCQKYTNYLMCYICSPSQNEFYKKERLTVCESFCDLLFEGCKYAVLKGNQIKQLYRSGREFCLSRRFLVGDDKNCLSVPYIAKLTTSEGNGYNGISIICMLMLPVSLFFSLMPDCHNFSSKKLRKKDKSSLLKMMFLLILLSDYIRQCQAHIVSYDEINNLGKSVSSFLEEYAKNSIVYPNYEESITSHSTKEVEDSVILKDIKDKLGMFFINRKISVKEMAKRVAFAHDRSSHNHSSTKALNWGSKAVRSAKSKNGDDEPEEEYSWLNEEAIEMDDSYAERTFFASRTGKFFVHPHRIVKSYEPRMQPWYLGVKEAPSNVILILDSSYTQDPKRFKRSKDAALLLLGSFAHHQRVAVISSSSPTWDSTGVEHNSSAIVLGCMKDRLIRATSGNVEMFVEAVRNINPSGGSDHYGAFRKAFDLLKKQQTTHQKYIECRSIIIFVTDGEQDEHLRCTPGYKQYTEGNVRIYQPGEICQHDPERLLMNIQKMQRSLPGAKANIFTFLTSHGRRSDISFCGNLACQNNGAFSRIHDDGRDMFEQMHPYFDYIRTREYSYDPIITGPYMSPIDGRLVLTFSAPVVAQGFSSILGVVGMDVLFSAIENLLEEHHEYLYLVNLVDGSAIIHPLIKKSYEGSREWNNIPLLSLEMEDSNHSVEFSEVLRGMMQKTSGSIIVRSNSSEGFEVEEGQALWKPVPSILHSFSDIPGTQFGFGIKAVIDRDQSRAFFTKVKRNYRPQTLEPDSKNYHHSLFAATLLPQQLSSELDITRNHVSYPGVPVSLEHSSIIFTPPAFCRTFVHFHSQEKLLDLQRLIDEAGTGGERPVDKGAFRDDNDDDDEDEDGDNKDGGSEDEKNTDEEEKNVDDNCLIKEMAKQDIITSLPLERKWKEVRMISGSLRSLYVTTMNGIIRHYPGINVPDGIIRHPLRYPWFAQAMLNPRKIVLTENRASFSGSPNVITVSRLFSPSHKVVLAADLLRDEMRQKFSNVLDSEVCCPPPPAYRNASCLARCYLISDRGEIVVSLSDGLDRSKSKNLHEQFPFLYQLLLKHKLIALMKISELKKNCSTDDDGSFGVHEPSRACMAIRTEFRIKSDDLERMGGAFGRALDEFSGDACHAGMFYVSAVNNTNLFFLSLFNYTSDRRLESCKQRALKLRKSFGLRLSPICPVHDMYYASRTNSTTCPKKRFISLYCRYSSDSSDLNAKFTLVFFVLFCLFLRAYEVAL